MNKLSILVGAFLCLMINVGYSQACSSGSNGYQMIDFNDLARGEVITTQYSGVTFSSSGGRKLVAFDTGTPTQAPIPGDNSNGDADMGSPNSLCPGGGPGIGAAGGPSGSGPNCTFLGNVLIIEEHFVDQDGDGHDDYPDDLGGGGEIIMEFDEPTTIGIIGFLDDIEVTVYICLLYTSPSPRDS